MLIGRRSFLRGLIAAPIVITTPGLLMPVRPLPVKHVGDLEFDATGRIVGVYGFDVGIDLGPVYAVVEMRRREGKLIRKLTGVDLDGSPTVKKFRSIDTIVSDWS